ncbi:MAG: hypothetical protein HY876_10785 [Coriobacteriales bacterium]|nr:hypothetical protein [Coriobacteriales bacterium]
MGSQVLGALVYGLYYPSPVLSAVNYASIVVAGAVYAFVLGKFVRATTLARNPG